jgi:hypothetical protein
MTSVHSRCWRSMYSRALIYNVNSQPSGRVVVVRDGDVTTAITIVHIGSDKAGEGTYVCVCTLYAKGNGMHLGACRWVCVCACGCARTYGIQSWGASSLWSATRQRTAARSSSSNTQQQQLECKCLLRASTGVAGRTRAKTAVEWEHRRGGRGRWSERVRAISVLGFTVTVRGVHLKFTRSEARPSLSLSATAHSLPHTNFGSSPLTILSSHTNFALIQLTLSRKALTRGMYGLLITRNSPMTNTTTTSSSRVAGHDCHLHSLSARQTRDLKLLFARNSSQTRVVRSTSIAQWSLRHRH